MPVKMDISRIDPNRLLIDPDSYCARPHSYHYFHHHDELGYRLDPVRAGARPLPLPDADDASDLACHRYGFRGETRTLDDYHERQGTLGFLVLRDGRLVHERYFHGSGPHSRFLSNSVGKSVFTSVVGDAVARGVLDLDEPVTRWVPELEGSGYGSATLRDLLAMTARATFTEDYTDPDADIHRYVSALVKGTPSLLEVAVLARPAPSDAPAFQYQTMATQILEFVLERATGLPANVMVERTLWKAMESDAFFFRHPDQPHLPVGGAFVATLRDYARLGQIALNGGVADGRTVLAPEWVAAATEPQGLAPGVVGNDQNYYENLGYGFGWWLVRSDAGEAFAAVGIFGQFVYVHPESRTVIVQNAAWESPLPLERHDESFALFDSIARQGVG